MKQTLNKILVIRGANIGDLICTTPMITSLRRYYPNARIDALVNSYNAPVIAGNPDINHVYFYTKAKHREDGQTVLGVHWARLKLLHQLRKQRYDLIVLANCGYLHRPIRLARMIGASRVIGFVADGIRDKIITTPVSFGDVHAHEVVKIHRLLEPLGIFDTPPALTLKPNADALQHAVAVIKNNRSLSDESSTRVAIHISARLLSQRWPAEYFIELMQALHSATRCSFVLFWSPGAEDNPHHPGDDGKANAIIDACTNLPLLPYATHALNDLIAGLACCDMMFCADGGAMHVGAALGLPVVAMFGEAPANNWYPWGVPYRVLQQPSRNVQDISVTEALTACLELLPQKSVS